MKESWILIVPISNIIFHIADQCIFVNRYLEVQGMALVDYLLFMRKYIQTTDFLLFLLKWREPQFLCIKKLKNLKLLYGTLPPFFLRIKTIYCYFQAAARHQWFHNFNWKYFYCFFVFVSADIIILSSLV